MAVSVQAPFYSRPGMWNLGDQSTAFSSTGSDGIPVSMSYQYPLGNSGLESNPNIIPGFHHPPPLDHTQSPSPSLSKATSPSLKNKTASGVNKSAKIRKSMSTPNVRGQSSADAAALALSAEKRRNKLGYHRTSVACGHCRRRKIRCIPAPADPQNRCSNCIRLKKECNFYPVDQQPPPDPRRRGSKAHSGNERQSESSSPSTSSGQLPEMPSNLPYAHLNMPPIQDLGGPQMKRQRTESFSPENKGSVIPLKPYPDSYPHPTVVTSSRNYEYPQGSQGPTNWMAPDASPSSKTQGDVPQTFWRPNPQDSPITPAFSPFTPGLSIPPSQNWPASHPEQSPREDLAWGSGPQRSISYSNIEGLQNQQHYSPYPNPPTPSVPEHYETKPRILPSSGSMYPPPISTSHLPSSGPASAPIHGAPDQHPHSANSLPPVPFSNWQHQQQQQQQAYSYQKPASAGTEHYAGWNTPQHGEHPPPPPGYGYGDPPGVYYAPSHHGR